MAAVPALAKVSQLSCTARVRPVHLHLQRVKIMLSAGRTKKLDERVLAKAVAKCLKLEPKAVVAVELEHLPTKARCAPKTPSNKTKPSRQAGLRAAQSRRVEMAGTRPLHLRVAAHVPFQ